jgi:general secretion pathway protein H
MSAKTERGFTLLELLVVIAIMAALTMAFPLALNRFVPARRVDSAARVLLADIRTAQSRSTNIDRPVSLEVTAHGYHVATETRELRTSTSIELRSADDVRGLSELKLFPDGSTTGGRFLIRDGTRVRTIDVSALTGRVSLGKGQ